MDDNYERAGEGREASTFAGIRGDFRAPPGLACVVTKRPSGLYATVPTATPLWSNASVKGSPERTSHARAVPPADGVTIRAPSGLKSVREAAPNCSSGGPTGTCDTACHTCTDPSADELA